VQPLDGIGGADGCEQISMRLIALADQASGDDSVLMVLHSANGQVVRRRFHSENKQVIGSSF
jgi:hypothetical protein